jgi:hypothetical protein
MTYTVAPAWRRPWEWGKPLYALTIRRNGRVIWRIYSREPHTLQVHASRAWLRLRGGVLEMKGIPASPHHFKLYAP